MQKLKDLPALKGKIRELAPQGKPNFAMIFEEGTQVATWNRQFGGPEVAAAFIVVLLSDLVNNFNTFEKMTDGQREDLALDMAVDLWWVKMEEIAAFFEGCKRGYYGKITNRLDPPIVWEMWDKYEDFRNEACEARQKANHTILSMPRVGDDPLDRKLIEFAASFTKHKNSER